MDSKVSEKDMREVYFQAFGKEYDSADRKQAPLPIEIAYLVALQKLEREGKYAGGGEITDDNYYQSVNHFVYFCMNYPNDFLDAFGSLKTHLSNKFKDYYNRYGTYSVMIKFYTELDGKNRRILTDYSLKNYKGTPISSDISDIEYFNSVNHFIYFCFNFPSNFMDAFSSHLKVHLSSKWSSAYERKGSIGAMIFFWSELDGENRKKLATWSKNNYTGIPLYELGGGLGDVAGMLPSPLPMSTIQPMEKGGRVGYYNNLRDLLELRDNGTKTIILNGFRENIGYVIDLKLDDQDLIKIEDGVYETTYKKGGQIELFADGGGIKVGDVVEVKQPNYGRDRDYYVVADNVGYDRNDFLISDVKKREQGVFEEEQLEKLYADGGGVESDYYIFEGMDNLNGKPLYRVESTSESDNEYVGEWHTDKSDAEKELKSFYADGGSVDDFDSTGTSMVIYHEKEGNFMIPKGQIYLYLYDIEKSGKKIQSGEFDWVFYPFASLSMIGQKGFIPPLKRIWTKKFQKEHKGSEHLLGVIKAFLIDKENGEKELYIDMMSVNPTKKKKGIMSFMIKDLRNNFNLSQNQVTFSQLTKDGEKFVEKGKYSDGGDVEYEVILWGVKVGEPNWAEQILTKQEDKIEVAKKWAEKNGFDRFRISKIKLDKPDFTKTFSDGGDVYDSKFKEGVKVETTVFMSTEDIGSNEDIEAGTIGTVLSEPNDEEDLVLVEIKGVRHYLPQDVLEVFSEYNNDDCINSILTSVNKIKPIADFGISDKKLIIIVKEQLTIDEIELLNNNLKNIKGCSEITDDEFTISYKENNKTLILNLKTDDFSIQKFKNGGGVNVGYNVFNYTDNIYATDEVFKTKALANKFIKEFRNRFANQGYYRDNRMNKINIQDIDLLAIPSDFNPLKKYADGGNVSGFLSDSQIDKLNKLEVYTYLTKIDPLGNFNVTIGTTKSLREVAKKITHNKKSFSDGGGVDVDLEDDFKKALVTSNFTYYTNNSDGIRMFRNSDNEELTGGVFAENSLTEDIENNDVVWASEDMKYNIDAMREKYSLGGILLSVGAGAFAYKLYLDYKKQKDKKRLEDFIKDEAKYYSEKIKSKINIDDDFQEDEERASRRMERDSDDMFQEREERASRRMERDSDDMFQERE